MNKMGAKAEFEVGRRALVAALRRLRNGDFSVSLPDEAA